MANSPIIDPALPNARLSIKSKFLKQNYNRSAKVYSAN